MDGMNVQCTTSGVLFWYCVGYLRGMRFGIWMIEEMRVDIYIFYLICFDFLRFLNLSLSLFTYHIHTETVHG